MKPRDKQFVLALPAQFIHRQNTRKANFAERVLYCVPFLLTWIKVMDHKDNLRLFCVKIVGMLSPEIRNQRLMHFDDVTRHFYPSDDLSCELHR